jgi:hypothetical protein
MRVDAVDIVVADLSDVIRSKRAAGRPKDLRVAPVSHIVVEAKEFPGARSEAGCLSRHPQVVAYVKAQVSSPARHRVC